MMKPKYLKLIKKKEKACKKRDFKNLLDIFRMNGGLLPHPPLG